MWRWDIDTTLDAQVSVTEVIGQNNDHIRPFGLSSFAAQYLGATAGHDSPEEQIPGAHQPSGPEHGTIRGVL
jgi:hypothetical protein